MRSEEKKQLQLRQLAQQGKVEQASAMQKLEEDDSNDMFNLKQTKKDLKKALQGKDLQKVNVHRWKCKECGTQFKSFEMPAKCKNCGESEGFSEEGVLGETHIWVQSSAEQLVNDKGFDVIWREIESALNDNIQGSYLPPKVIEKEAKLTLKSIIAKLWPKHDFYGIVDKPSLGQVVGIVRKNLVAALNKARRGRAMVNNERTEVVKRNYVEEEEKSSNDNGLLGLGPDLT